MSVPTDKDLKKIIGRLKEAFKGMVKGTVTGIYDKVGNTTFYPNDDGIVTVELASGGGDSLPAGTVIPYAGPDTPNGWFPCDGREVSRDEYPALFEAIGTTYGAGDGTTTFKLPDYRESALVGTGTRATGVATHDTYTLGQFKDDQLQNHQHYRYAGNYNGWNRGIEQGDFFTFIQDSNEYSNGKQTGDVFGDESRKGTTTHGKRIGVNYIIKWTRQGSSDGTGGTGGGGLTEEEVNALIDAKVEPVEQKVDAQKKDVTVSAYMGVKVSRATNNVDTAQRATTVYFDNIEWSDYKIVLPRCLIDGSCVLLNARPENGKLVMDLYYTGQDTQFVQKIAESKSWFYTLDMNDTTLFTEKGN